MKRVERHLKRPQNRESRAPGKLAFTCFFRLEALDLCAERTRAAGLDHRIDCLALTGEHRLDAAIGAIADPPFEPTRLRFVCDEGAEPDALHAPGNSQTNNFARHLFDRDIVDEPRGTEAPGREQADRPFIAIGDARQSPGMAGLEIVDLKPGADHSLSCGTHRIADAVASLYPCLGLPQGPVKPRR